MRGLLRIIAVLVLGAGAAVGGTYQQVYMQQTSGAAQYSYIDPILDTNRQLAGFVFLSATEHAIVIDRWGQDTSVTITLDRVPAVCVNFVGPGDTLFCYVSCRHPWDDSYEMPVLMLIRQVGSWVDQKVIHPLYYWPGGFDIGPRETLKLRLEVVRDDRGVPTGVLYNFVHHFVGYILTIGIQSCNISTSIIYTLDLEQETIKLRCGFLCPGDYLSDDQLQYAGVLDYTYSFEDPDGEHGNWTERWSRAILMGSTRDTFLFDTTGPGPTEALFGGDFDPGMEKDELIYQGFNGDLTGDHPDSVWHIACYNFSSGVPVQLWYHTQPSYVPTFQFQSRGFLVGGRRDRETAFLNVSNGRVSDSVTIDRSLSATAYFETGTYQPSVNQVGRVADTIFVYRFDEITDVGDETPVASLPEGFALDANYPNPFNPHTEISFALARAGEVRLEIFNLLGQLVGTPMAGRLAAGAHRITWVAEDQAGNALASGVYLYRLTVDGVARTRKMTLVK